MKVNEEKLVGLSELLSPLTANEASVEANRCLYCFDAPCTHACPTHIDIPRFIKKIATNNLAGSAETIYQANLLGATCARVCPVQELCEGACVLGSEHKPIAIGRLQRHAMDHAREHHRYPKPQADQTGRTVAIIGAGPAGLSCAGYLALKGHTVTIFEKRELAGGLSTYGIIGLREPLSVAIGEVRMIEGLGVAIKTGVELSSTLTLEELNTNFDAVVLAVGLGRTPGLAIDGEELVVDGLEFVEASKVDPANVIVGRNVTVIGAGNTAIDCASIAKRMGAERVTIVYRRTEQEMTCYEHEHRFAQNEGIEFRFLAKPIRVVADEEGPTGLECQDVKLGAPDASGRRAPMAVPGSEFILESDQIIKAIGQEKPEIAKLLGLETNGGFIAVDSNFQTARSSVYAIGDCVRTYGDASTVMAVQDGKLAARFIDAALREVQNAGRESGPKRPAQRSV